LNAEILIILVILFPLIGFILNGIFGKNWSEKIIGTIGAIAVFIPFVLTLFLLTEVTKTQNLINYNWFNWLSVGSIHLNIGFLIDRLSIWMMLIITGIGFLIHVYSIGYMHGDKGFYKFFCLFESLHI
jgi:NADH-quinone oxidoreductase subunit L